MSSPTLHSTLRIQGLELNLNLGWRSKERNEEQAVLLDMEMVFPTPPSACLTDQLDDTVCYAKLTDKIRNQISAKSYRLVEHLAADIYTLAKQNMPDDTRVIVRITKYPRIGGLRNGISFEYGDQSAS
jgi:dihydroneopterin aldolase